MSSTHPLTTALAFTYSRPAHRAAFYRGVAARRHDRPKHSNPYTHGDDIDHLNTADHALAHAWEVGWLSTASPQTDARNHR